MDKLIVKKCLKCGAIIVPFKDCNCKDCGIKCCGEEMTLLDTNNGDDVSILKHIPNYEIIEDELYVKVNHPMEKDHYIEFIALVSDNKTYIEKLYPEMNAEVRFKYVGKGTLYSYCNKHGLWYNDIVKSK